MLHRLPPILPVAFAALGATLLTAPMLAAPAKVTIVSTGSEHQLQVNGMPYVINGVGGTQHLEMLSTYGGNTVRTWGIESLDEPVDGKPLIKRAEELGLMVAAGIWLEHERHGFDYGDQRKVREQRENHNPRCAFVPDRQERRPACADVSVSHTPDEVALQ